MTTGPGDIADVQSRACHVVQGALASSSFDARMARVVLTVIDLQRRNVGLLGAESISWRLSDPRGSGAYSTAHILVRRGGVIAPPVVQAAWVRRCDVLFMARQYRHELSWHRLD